MNFLNFPTFRRFLVRWKTSNSRYIVFFIYIFKQKLRFDNFQSFSGLFFDYFLYKVNVFFLFKLEYSFASSLLYLFIIMSFKYLLTEFCNLKVSIINVFSSDLTLFFVTLFLNNLYCLVVKIKCTYLLYLTGQKFKIMYIQKVDFIKDYQRYMLIFACRYSMQKIAAY